MTRLADGDRSAFAEVYAALQPVVTRFAARVWPSEAEDLAQRVLLKIFEQAPDYDPSKDVVSWAFAITAWEARTAKRSAARRLAKKDTRPEQETPEALLSDAEWVAAASDVLGRLTEEEREALVTTHASPTLRKRKQRALERARQLWRKLYA